MRPITYALAAGCLMATVLTTPVAAGTLENMERERALAIDTFLSADITPNEREERLALARARLVDLERMVMRDESLQGKNTPAVRNTFENYDLSFMAHASVERNRSMIDHWLEQVGVSTNSLMSARLGRR